MTAVSSTSSSNWVSGSSMRGSAGSVMVAVFQVPNSSAVGCHGLPGAHDQGPYASEVPEPAVSRAPMIVAMAAILLAIISVTTPLGGVEEATNAGDSESIE
ncbi:hypothetical protein APR09_004376 [Nocardia amikacinitolerans]|nr:hypothetical protein [Nocardia amikacinitolerans]